MIVNDKTEIIPNESMENKLEQLTRRLYDEGLSKGRARADELVAEAEAKAKKIVADARADAERIVAEAGQSAAELKKNTRTEIALAARQSVSALKESIRTMIVARTAGKAVGGAMLDAEFVKELLLETVRNWQASGGEAGLKALLPAGRKQELDAAFASAAKALLDAGVELEYADGVKNGFRIGPKDGGYYLSFTDADFNALLDEYLRPQVAGLLYGEETGK